MKERRFVGQCRVDHGILVSRMSLIAEIAGETGGAKQHLSAVCWAKTLRRLHLSFLFLVVDGFLIMDYNDEYHGSGSFLAYDGELLPFADAFTRYKRDEDIREKYVEAEKTLDDLQMTWEDVRDGLT